MGHVYATLDDFKAFLSGGDVGTERDVVMRIVLVAASHSVDSFCRRGDGFAAALADTIPATALDGSVTDTDTVLTVLSVTGLYVGQMLLIEDEEVEVLAVDDMALTLTVLRGQTGTAAAAHVDTTVVSAFRYPAEVTDATLRLAQRRWKMRDAGVTGDYGIEGVTTANHDTEISIMARTLGHLRRQVVA